MFSFVGYQRQTSHLANSWLGLQIMQPVMFTCQRLLERLYMKILQIFFSFVCLKCFLLALSKHWISSNERVRMWKDCAWPDIESCNLSFWLHTPNTAVMLKHRACYRYYFHSVWNIFSFGFNKALDSRGINKKGIMSAMECTDLAAFTFAMWQMRWHFVRGIMQQYSLWVHVVSTVINELSRTVLECALL